MRVDVQGDRHVGMSEGLLNHLGVGADREHQGGTGVPEVVEPDVGQPCTLKQPFEGPVYEVVAAHGRTQPCSKDEIVILPEPDEGLPLLKLAFSVPLQGFCGLQQAPVEVDVLPLEAKELALPGAGGDGNDVERFEPILTDGLKQRLDLIRAKRLDLLSTHLRRLDGVRDVAGEQSVVDSLLERVVDRCGRALWR